MNLEQLINQYISYRKSLGEKFKTNEACLKAFCKTMGASTKIKSITENMVIDFLYGNLKAVTSGWFVKHTAVFGFYQYVLTRGYVTTIPLPKTLPKRPELFVPYIYSNQELKKIFKTALIYQKIKSHIQPYMVRIILFITYALGLRLCETLSIKLADINTKENFILVQKSKFYKSRLVPYNKQVAKVINDYIVWRKKRKCSQLATAPLFVGKNDNVFNDDTMRGIFQKIREKAKIRRDDNTTYQPRMHDLRHTFAVNRLTSWYRENKDVQKLLPVLSTYLGHKYLAHTSVYLTMTKDLLKEANTRFEKYALGELL